MAEKLTFHFEGALADSHQMNFYEASRFQYAAARLMVKLAQFRQTGRFVQKITNNSNFNIHLSAQIEGSFNINVEDVDPHQADGAFINISLSDLIAYVSERIIEKINDANLGISEIDDPLVANEIETVGEFIDVELERLAKAYVSGKSASEPIAERVQDLVKRRAAEIYRDKRLTESQASISRIDFARSQKLIAMSAPLISEMATALRRSAQSLEITSSVDGQSQAVLFLDRGMAEEIETAIVDKEITPILGDITQFNKDNGWGKLKIENGTKTLSFSIPSDLLQSMKQKLIDNMKKDLVYLQTYFVRDRSGDVMRLIAVGILPAPEV